MARGQDDDMQSNETDPVNGGGSGDGDDERPSAAAESALPQCEWRCMRPVDGGLCGKQCTREFHASRLHKCPDHGTFPMEPSSDDGS